MTTEKPDKASDQENEIARIAAIIGKPGSRVLSKTGRALHTGIKPRNAATLIILKREGAQTLVLMGKRHSSVKFMPGAMVFPGGSVDSGDGKVHAGEELSQTTLDRIMSNMRGTPSKHAARALAIAAIRETAEECGLLIGQIQDFDSVNKDFDSVNKDWACFAEAGITPSLAGMRLFARAITPPGAARRFDTWFFVTTADRIAYTPQSGFSPSGELEDLRWINPKDAMLANTREITRIMLAELMDRLQRDPELDPGYPAPFYRAAHNQFIKSIMA